MKKSSQVQSTLFNSFLGNKPSRPVAVFERRAASVTQWGGTTCHGCWVIDFGRELQGGVNLSVTGATGGDRMEVNRSPIHVVKFT